MEDSIISSTADSKTTVELAAEVTWNIFHLDILLDNISACTEELKTEIEKVKQVANLVHGLGTEDRKEEILGYLSVTEELKSSLKILCEKYEHLSKEALENLEN